jgi:hypothetical protein
LTLINLSNLQFNFLFFDFSGEWLNSSAFSNFLFLGLNTSTCTTDNVQTCNTNSIQYNNKIKENCEICLQKISYSCTCLVQNIQDGKKIQQECDIEINTTSIVANPSHKGFPSHYNIPPPDLIVALDCEFVGVHPKNTSALGII